MAEISVEPIAEDTLLLRFGDGIDIEVNARVHAAAQALRTAGLPGILDVAPAYATLLVRFDPLARISGNGALPFEHIAGRVRSILEAAAGESSACGFQPGTGERQPSPSRPNPLPQTMERAGGEGDAREPRRRIEIPVCYGGEYGPDLDAAAGHVGLTPDEIVAKHSAAEYTVAMIGFAPGFPYLLGLHPALRMPRRADPRTRVPAGSVAIGGAQTGIYPRELPGGWQLIGRTPRVLFDPGRQPPCLLAPGDRVRFRAIDGDEFAKLVEQPDEG